jgi:hypothetical protein
VGFYLLCRFEKQYHNYNISSMADPAGLAEALREEQYAFNQEELRPYFSLPRVQQVLLVVGNPMLAAMRFFFIRACRSLTIHHPDCRCLKGWEGESDLMVTRGCSGSPSASLTSTLCPMLTEWRTRRPFGTPTSRQDNHGVRRSVERRHKRTIESLASSLSFFSPRQ